MNDFNKFGRTWQVNLQADAKYRVSADAVRQFRVRNANGEMVPLASLATVRDDYGPVFVVRYNMMTAVTLNGMTMPSVSSGTAIETMEALCDRTLPRTMGYEWSELSYMQRETERVDSLRPVAGSVRGVRQGGGAVFLVLAALRAGRCRIGDSGGAALPLVRAGIWFASMDLNTFVQSFVVLVGRRAERDLDRRLYATGRRTTSLFDATAEAAGAAPADHRIVRAHPRRVAAGLGGGRGAGVEHSA